MSRGNVRATVSISGLVLTAVVGAPAVSGSVGVGRCGRPGDCAPVVGVGCEPSLDESLALAGRAGPAAGGADDAG